MEHIRTPTKWLVEIVQNLLEAVETSLRTYLLGASLEVEDLQVVARTRISGNTRTWATIRQALLAGTPIYRNRISRRRYPPLRKHKRNRCFLRVDILTVQRSKYRLPEGLEKFSIVAYITRSRNSSFPEGWKVLVP